MTIEQKLLNRWTLDLANHLIDEGWTRKEAFKQAHLCRRLLECLGMGTVVFEYEKKDGSVRRARGTLCKGISKDFASCHTVPGTLYVTRCQARCDSKK
jgi:hypothetical protein